MAIIVVNYSIFQVTPVSGFKFVKFYCNYLWYVRTIRFLTFTLIIFLGNVRRHHIKYQDLLFLSFYPFLIFLFIYIRFLKMPNKYKYTEELLFLVNQAYTDTGPIEQYILYKALYKIYKIFYIYFSTYTIMMIHIWIHLQSYTCQMMLSVYPIYIFVHKCRSK